MAPWYFHSPCACSRCTDPPSPLPAATSEPMTGAIDGRAPGHGSGQQGPKRPDPLLSRRGTAPALRASQPMQAWAAHPPTSSQHGHGGFQPAADPPARGARDGVTLSAAVNTRPQPVMAASQHPPRAAQPHGRAAVRQVTRRDAVPADGDVRSYRCSCLGVCFQITHYDSKKLPFVPVSICV